MNLGSQPTLNNFDELALHPTLKKSLKAMNFVKPTPIQGMAIPLVIEGHDLIAGAQTGSGKTAAYSLPLITKIAENPTSTALVLVPTRELAEQVMNVWVQILKPFPQIRVVSLIGGTSLVPQIRNLQKKPQLIVATPGRMMDHLRRRSISLSKLKYLVLDEADRMLDMGFAPQLNEILRFLPAERQTLLFSATLPSNILKLSQKFLTNPRHVQVEKNNQNKPKIDQKVLEVHAKEKNEALLNELNAREGSVLVFARTQVRTNKVNKFLIDYGFKVDHIHGGRTQAQRKKALEKFKNGHIRVLVATDVAARGLDISHVAHVINFDLPQDPDDYVHRIGRTARAGRSGEAISFVTPEDQKSWRSIARKMNLASPQGKGRPTSSRN